jgi:hypothetical protein
MTVVQNLIHQHCEIFSQINTQDFVIKPAGIYSPDSTSMMRLAGIAFVLDNDRASFDLSNMAGHG